MNFNFDICDTLGYNDRVINRAHFKAMHSYFEGVKFFAPLQIELVEISVHPSHSLDSHINMIDRI